MIIDLYLKMEGYRGPYYKFTNAEENHNGIQYKDGLNVLEEFDPSNKYCEFHFSDSYNVINFFDCAGSNGFIRIVYIPDDAKFTIISKIKFKTNKIFFADKINVRDKKKLLEILTDDDSFFSNFIINNFNVDIQKIDHKSIEKLLFVHQNFKLADYLIDNFVNDKNNLNIVKDILIESHKKFRIDLIIYIFDKFEIDSYLDTNIVTDILITILKNNRFKYSKKLIERFNIDIKNIDPKIIEDILNVPTKKIDYFII